MPIEDANEAKEKPAQDVNYFESLAKKLGINPDNFATSWIVMKILFEEFAQALLNEKIYLTQVLVQEKQIKELQAENRQLAATDQLRARYAQFVAELQALISETHKSPTYEELVTAFRRLGTDSDATVFFK